jgi:hypothetical protein
MKKKIIIRVENREGGKLCGKRDEIQGGSEREKERGMKTKR